MLHGRPTPGTSATARQINWLHVSVRYLSRMHHTDTQTLSEVSKRRFNISCCNFLSTPNYTRYHTVLLPDTFSVILNNCIIVIAIDSDFHSHSVTTAPLPATPYDDLQGECVNQTTAQTVLTRQADRPVGTDLVNLIPTTEALCSVYLLILCEPRRHVQTQSRGSQRSAHNNYTQWTLLSFIIMQMQLLSPLIGLKCNCNLQHGLMNQYLYGMFPCVVQSWCLVYSSTCIAFLNQVPFFLYVWVLIN